jgi:glycerophosphoryl diester phosphodiesterase
MAEHKNRPLIIAHRGAGAWAPENTLVAFRLAIDQGADGIELDVRLSKDEQAVVIHDATLERTGRKFLKVADLTAAELAKVDVGSWFNAVHPKKADQAYVTETVPSLEQTLNRLKDFRGLIYVELKCRDSEVEKLSRAVCKVISGSPLLPQIIVKSFKLGVIPRVRFGCPQVKTAALFAPKIMRYLRKEKHLVKIAEEFGADHLSLHYSLVSRKLMRKVEKAGLKVTIWTANKPSWVRRGTDLGLFAIITNDPAKLLDATSGPRKRIVLREAA